MLAFRIETSEDDAAAMFAGGQRALQRLGDDASLAVLMSVYGALRQNAGAIDGRLTGEADAARRELTEAHRLFAQMGATGHAERIAATIDAAARRT